jgi:hypothetical protein
MISLRVCVSVCLLSIWIAATMSTCAAEGESDAEFVSMFNGKDLTGWEGSPGWWEVRDGVLVAESTPEKPCQRSHYLYWKDGEPANFEMRATYRIGGKANSGIQFRSQRRAEWDTWGYQADLDTAGEYTGCLYQHERGLVAERGQRVQIDAAGNKTITTFGDSKKLLAAVKPDDWNDYRILADGPNISLWINGQLMCQVEDHQEKFALPRGIIALQMHQGPPMKVEFKDLRIRVLK